MVKNSLANVENARDTDLIPESERFPGVGSGKPLLRSCQDPMDRAAWQVTVQGVTKEDMTK